MRDQGLSLSHLFTIFQAIVFNRMAYAISSLGLFLNMILSQRINGFKEIVSVQFHHVFEMQQL